MSARTRNESLRSLQLPDPFEDLTGVIGSDLKVIATASRRTSKPPADASAAPGAATSAQALEQSDARHQRDDGLAHG